MAPEFVPLLKVQRDLYRIPRGEARTLGEMLAQEGYATTRAGCDAPVLPPDERARAKRIIEPLSRRSDRPTLIAAVFGDAAARALGYDPLGLPDRAGLALALDDARKLTA